MIADAILDLVVEVLARKWAPPPDPPALEIFATWFRWTEGMYKDQQVNPRLHPAQFIVLRAIGLGLNRKSNYRRFIVIKPTQDGGTWNTVTFPLLYCTTQLHRPFAAGFPDMRLASIAWRNKIRAPVVAARRQAWLPDEGPGSEGSSAPVEVALASVPAYFMGGGASNEAGQAGLTAFALVRDERDAMDPYTAELMRGRLDGYDDQAVSIDTSTIKDDEASAILADYSESVAIRVAFACPACGGYQILDDDMLVYDATSELTAMKTARMKCRYPDCAHLITDAERVGSPEIPGMIDLERTVEVGRGQELQRDGTVTGQLVDTLAWGLLWSAFDSPIKSLSKLASERWAAEVALRAGNHEKMRRYKRDRCSTVYRGDRVDRDGLDAVALATRSATSPHALGIVPALARFLTGTVDVQKRELWWQIMAHGEAGRWWIVAHGREVVTQDFRAEPTVEEVVAALNRVDAIMAEGLYIALDEGPERMPVLLRGIDVRYQGAIVLPWLEAQDGLWLAVRGTGDGLLSEKPRGDRIERIEGVIDVRLGENGLPVHYIEAAPIKHDIMAALARPQGSSGAGDIPKGEAADGWLIKQLLAEKLVGGKWVKMKRDNHQLDLGVYNRGLGRLAESRGALGVQQPGEADMVLEQGLAALGAARRGRGF